MLELYAGYLRSAGMIAGISAIVSRRVQNDRDPRIMMISDKLQVQEYVRRLIGDDALPKRFLATANPGEILEVKLPARYVVKASFGSGMTALVHHDSPSERERVAAVAGHWLERRFQEPWQMWLYGRHLKQILVEELLGSGDSTPHDYKLFCFGGGPKFIQIDVNRFSAYQRSFVTPEWNVIPCRYATCPGIADEVPQPESTEALLDTARRLSRGFDFLRVDLYMVDSKVFFGELTPWPSRGGIRFTPRSYDRRFGRFFVEPSLSPEALARLA